MNSSVGSIMASVKKIFFVGIGGISMSSLALACRALGYNVAGSDRTSSDMTEKLAGEKIKVTIGHAAENISGFDAVVYTGAISEDNPELCAAREKNIPVIYRADLLGWLMLKFPRRIGISGMHGKSTTTSMITHVFLSAGEDPTVMIGAETKELNGACRFGEGRDFIFEACEYRDSFLDMFPTVSVILNIDLDHTDYFPDIDAICDSFEKFAQLPFDSDAPSPMLIACGDDGRVLNIASRSPRDVTFGITNTECDYLARNVSEKNGYYTFDVFGDGEPQGKVSLKVPGVHNIYNALASYAVCDVCGIPHDKICSALSDFEGTKRRFEYKGSCDGAAVYIDYAHHPTEIEAAISAAKKVGRGGRVITLFEPHTFSRTRDHLTEFVETLSKSDLVIMLDIYAAREINTTGITSSMIADMIPGAMYAPDYDGAAALVRTYAEEGDIVLILGAGTVYQIADKLTSPLLSL